VKYLKQFTVITNRKAKCLAFRNPNPHHPPPAPPTQKQKQKKREREGEKKGETTIKRKMGAKPSSICSRDLSSSLFYTTNAKHSPS